MYTLNLMYAIYSLSVGGKEAIPHENTEVDIYIAAAYFSKVFITQQMMKPVNCWMPLT